MAKKRPQKKTFTTLIIKKIFNINNINIKEILISKELFTLLNPNEYVIAYKHNHNIKLLYIKLPEYVCRSNTFQKNMAISSKIKDVDFFEKYNKIWKKIEELMGINFEIKPTFCNNIACITEIKTLSSYSEDYQDMIIPRKKKLQVLIHCYFTFCKHRR